MAQFKVNFLGNICIVHEILFYMNSLPRKIILDFQVSAYVLLRPGCFYSLVHRTVWKRKLKMLIEKVPVTTIKEVLGHINKIN